MEKFRNEELFIRTKKASACVLEAGDEAVSAALVRLSSLMMEREGEILSANKEDLSRMDPSDPKYDRLSLTHSRLQGIADGIDAVASLPSPVGKVLSSAVRPNGLKIERVSYPFGVVGIIYEARPNVTFDVAALCLKSGNACVLRGGKEADGTNRVSVEIIKDALTECGIGPDAVNLLPSDRSSSAELLHARGYVDLIIPRGSSSLISFARDNATVPLIETGAGVCHTYFDEEGDLQMGERIVVNAKTRRVSVCNALDCLIMHSSRLSSLPSICRGLEKSKVIIYADKRSHSVLDGLYPYLEKADAEDFGTEFLDYKMAIKTVDSLDEAISHIREYGSGHSESIVTMDPKAAERFRREVDAACVYVNAPTSFSDGGEFGLGAEIGISTQKMHARGPMGLEALTTYKWLIEGEGQTRP